MRRVNISELIARPQGDCLLKLGRRRGKKSLLKLIFWIF